MGIRDIFKKKAASEPVVVEIRLNDLKTGYMVDYDMKTWEVTASHYYDWGDASITREWQLKSADETVYLSMESDDDISFCISRKIPFDRVGLKTKKKIMETGDPPDEIELDGVLYHLEETAGGHFYKDGRGSGREMLSWDFKDDAGRNCLAVEQWGENDFEASLGETVEEYQFSNILPNKG